MNHNSFYCLKCILLLLNIITTTVGVKYKLLWYNIFGSGFSLILNPDYDDNAVSSFPITLFWQWEILRHIRNFNSNKFSFTPEAFFNLAIDILDISKVQILAIAVNTFVTLTTESSRFEQLVADINMLYGSNIDIND